MFATQLCIYCIICYHLGINQTLLSDNNKAAGADAKPEPAAVPCAAVKAVAALWQIPKRQLKTLM